MAKKTNKSEHRKDDKGQRNEAQIVLRSENDIATGKTQKEKDVQMQEVTKVKRYLSWGKSQRSARKEKY